MDTDSKFIIRKISFDFILLACVAFPMLFLFLWGKPFERGFFCDDESLRHPFHPSTVNRWTLNLVGLGGPIIIILITEYVIHRGKASKRSFMGRKIPQWMLSAYNVIGVFGFGAACQHLTTDIAEYSIGRLRPHFIDVCDPNIDCKDPNNLYRYIEDFECKGSNQRLIKEMRLSFPSGHSSLSTFTMIYLAVYVQCRLTWAGSKLLKHSIQLVVLMLAWFTMMSRVSDYKHHWSDVLAGALIGVVTAILILSFVSDLWKPRRTVLSPHLDKTEYSSVPSKAESINEHRMKTIHVYNQSKNVQFENLIQ